MIVGNRKSFEEIVGMLEGYRRVLVLGCRECVTVCAVGGEREVGVLASELRLYYGREGREVEVGEAVLERQCDYEYIDSIRSLVGDYEVVIETTATATGTSSVAGVTVRASSSLAVCSITPARRGAKRCISPHSSRR